MSAERLASAGPLQIVTAALHLLLVGVAVAWAVSQAAFIGVDFHHDGILLKPAMDVAAGKSLFRETMTIYGPLTTWIQAWFIMLDAGPGPLHAIRLSAASFYVVAFILAWLTWRALLPPAWTTATCIMTLGLAPFFIWNFVPWSSIYALVFLLAAILLQIRYLQQRAPVLLLAAGVATALAMWCRQPVGLAMTGAFCLSLTLLTWCRMFSFREAARGALWFAGGWLAVSAIVGVLLAATGAVGDWWRQNILFMISWRAAVAGAEPFVPRLLRSLFPGFSPLFPDVGVFWSMVPSATMLVLAWSIVNCRRKMDDRDAAAALVMACGALASWHQYYPQTCVRHVFWGAFPMFGVMVYGLHAVLARLPLRKPVRTLAMATMLALAAGEEIHVRLKTFAARVPHLPYAGSAPLLQGIYLNAVQADFVRRWEDSLAAARNILPGRRLHNGTPDAFYACYEPRQFSPMYVDFDGFLPYPYPELPVQRRAFIERERPLVVAYPGKFELPEGYRPFATLVRHDEQPNIMSNRSVILWVPSF